MLKERSKAVKVKKQTKSFEIGKRLNSMIVDTNNDSLLPKDTSKRLKTDKGTDFKSVY